MWTSESVSEWGREVDRGPALQGLNDHVDTCESYSAFKLILLKYS